jgi:hypothetical protein
MSQFNEDVLEDVMGSHEENLKMLPSKLNHLVDDDV